MANKNVKLKDGNDYLFPQTTVANITDLTASASEINVLDGITATTEELNILDGVTVNATNINNGINAITDNQATVGQFLVADGNGGCAWQTIPQANTQSF